MVKRFQGNGRIQEGGLLATHKQDFNAHVTGGDWYHNADQIRINPAIVGLGTTVHAGLESLLAIASSSGTGFVSVGDFDGYAQGSYNVGTGGYSSLREALVAAFADSRLQNGGSVFILAGTYTVDARIDVPAGISLIGDIAGTIINGEMTAQAMFRILSGSDRPGIGGDTGSGAEPLEPGAPLDETRFTNLILVDNLNGTITDAGFVVSSMQTKPMVEMEGGSRFICEGVKFVGRVNDAASEVARGKTLSAIGTTSAGTQSTHLTVRSCFFDGMKTMLDFSPSNGSLDHLVVDKCRARVFGDESTTDAATNCFITMSLCNARITNNYFKAFGDFAATQFVRSVVTLTSSVVGAGTNDVVAIITGNSGDGVDNGTSNSLISDPSDLLNFRTVVSGNSWGGEVNSQWYVTIGGGGSDFGGKSFGDFNGPGAIDQLYTLNGVNKDVATTVIVNEGTYDVTVSTAAASTLGVFNFVGNKRHSSASDTLPIFDLALGGGASSDYIGNLALGIGRYIKGIHFRCSVAKATNIHSVMPGGSVGIARGLFIEDCIFENVCLSIKDVISGGSNDTAGSNVIIRNCNFRQTDDFSDNFSVFIPPADNILIEGCKFSGSGYVGFIGTDGIFGSFLHNIDSPSTVIRDTIMDKTGFTIDDASPINGTYPNISYLVVNHDGNILLDNCMVLANNVITTEATATYNASLLSGLATPSFVQLSANDIRVDRCTFNTPVQSFLYSAANYLLPGLHAGVANEKFISITNSTFSRSAMALKVGGASSVLASSYGGLFVDNCRFLGQALTLAGMPTLIDVELDPSTGRPPSIRLTNNVFDVDGTHNDGSIIAYHGLITTNYDAAGIVQVYAEDCDIHFRGNTLTGRFGDAPNGPAKNDEAGVVLDNSNAGSNTGLAGIFASDNHISVTSENDDGISSIAAALWIRGSGVTVTNNQLHMFNNRGVTDGGGIHVMVIETFDNVGSQPVSPALVTGNLFSKREVDDGIADDLFNGYIYVKANTEGDGLVVNNVFSDQTDTDGYNQESAVYTNDIIGSAFWSFHSNKNQTVEEHFKGAVGAITINDVNVGDAATISINSRVSIPNNSGKDSNQVTFIYVTTDAGSIRNFIWEVCLRGLLPPDVTIISVTITYNLVSTPDTTNDMYIYVYDDNGTDISGVHNPSGTSSFTFAPSSTFLNTVFDRANISLRWICNDTATERTLHLRDFYVTYVY